MAKKTESTAVNDLINLMQTQGAPVKDPSADLFAEPPRKMPKGASGMFTMSPPPAPSKATRMSGKVPAVNSAGDVDPLPRRRGMGTQQNIQAQVAARMSTVVPSRENTIPSMEAAPPAPENIRASRPALPVPRTQSGHSLPPPSRTSTPPARLSGQHAVPPVPPPARLSGQHVVPPAPPSRKMTPVSVPRTATQSLAALPVPPALTSFDVEIDEQPMVAKPMVAKPVAASPAGIDMTSSAPWFADSNAVAIQTPFENTSKMHARRSAMRELAKKLALPTIAMICLGGAIGGYIAMSRKAERAHTATTETKAPVTATTVTMPETPVAVAPIAQPTEQKVAVPAQTKIETAAPVEAKVETPAPVEQRVAAPVEQTLETRAPVLAKLVDVRIDSTPSHAEVTLVDHGKMTFLGSTPISASVDPSRTYEVMLSYPNKPSKVEKLDPKTTTRLAISFDKTAPVETPKAAPIAKAATAPVVKVATAPVVKEAPVAKEAPAKHRVEAVAPKTEVAAAQPAKAEKTVAKVEKTEAKTEKVEAASEGGEGVLMLGSKPPCEITVDGKATGLMTPQRAMKLSVGKHTIKLSSADGEHNKTLTVDIKADKPTKVIEDLLGL